MPDNMKKPAILLAIILLTASAGAQTTSRWIRLPRHGAGEINKSPLSNSADPGVALRFTYEAEPVKPIMRSILRSFPEANTAEEKTTEVFDLGRSTIAMEELLREAEEILENPELGLIGLPASQPVQIATQTPVATAPVTELNADFGEPETITASAVSLALDGSAKESANIATPSQEIP